MSSVPASSPHGDAPAGGQLAGPVGAAAGTARWDPQRMEALAQVAGGIAPALSDLLTVIRGQSGLLLDAADHDVGEHESLKQIYSAAEKAGSLIRQLLIFSRQQVLHAVILDLNGLIDETAGVLRRVLGDGISVEFQLAPGLPLILADPDMLEQVLIILALNARDAMPTGGRLSFKTEVVESAEGPGLYRSAGRCLPDPRMGHPYRVAWASRPSSEKPESPGQLIADSPDSTPGKFVVLQVEDTGGGIAAEILPRVFEPFFTTKAGGRSIGLGLATVFGIVQQHHGWITVESVVNAGTTFNVFLPAAPPGSVAESGRGTGAGARAGNETILLVEDDVAVREFTVAVLQKHGYRVLQAGSGKDAMEVWKWHGPRVRLLLTDMVLEDEMSGLELAAKLRAENPRLKVICTSGHQRETMERFPGLSGGFEFIQKPCRPQALVAAVRALLEDKQP